MNVMSVFLYILRTMCGRCTYIKMCRVLKQIIIIYFAYLTTFYMAIFEIIKGLYFRLCYKVF
jgi:hypothetical protein